VSQRWPRSLGGTSRSSKGGAFDWSITNQGASNSEYMPKAYEPLFQNPKYQQKQYFAFQKKKESLIQNEKEDSASRLKERKEAEL
jgi:hypothetical protein